MSEVTIARSQEVEGGENLRPSGPVLEALVALLERDGNRPIQVGPNLYLRACSFIPVLLEILEEVQEMTQPEPQSLSVATLERIASYTAEPAA